MRLTCKEASRLLSDEMDGRLTLSQRATLRLHLAVCGACTNVKAQFEFLRKALASYSHPGDRDGDSR